MKDFKLIFDAVKDDPSKLTGYFKNFFENSRRISNEWEAPEWKAEIRKNSHLLVEKLLLHD